MQMQGIGLLIALSSNCGKIVQGHMHTWMAAGSCTTLPIPRSTFPGRTNPSSFLTPPAALAWVGPWLLLHLGNPQQLFLNLCKLCLARGTLEQAKGYQLGAVHASAVLDLTYQLACVRVSRGCSCMRQGEQRLQLHASG